MRALLAIPFLFLTALGATFSSGVSHVSTLADLAACGTNGPSVVVTLGRAAANDGNGGEWFRVASGTYTIDNGVVVAGTGCQWARSDWLRGKPVMLDWYGAPTDGSDARTYIRNALTNVMAGPGKTLELGPHTYAIGGASESYQIQLTNWHSGLTIQGQGTNSVFLVNSGTSPDVMFYLNNAGNITFRNLCLDGNNALVPSAYRARGMVVCYGSNSVAFDAVKFSNWYDKALIVYDTTTVEVKNSEFTGMIYEANGTGIYTGSTNVVLSVEGCNFHDMGGWKYFLDLGATKPNDGDTITCTDETTRTFRTAPTDPATEILIGATAAETETNVVTHLAAYPFAQGRVSTYVPITQVGITFRNPVTLACNAATATVKGYQPPQCIYASYFSKCDVRNNRFIRTGPAVTFRFSGGVLGYNYIENDSRMDVSGSLSYNASASWDGYHEVPPSRCQIVGNTISGNRAAYAFSIGNASNHVIANNIVLRPWDVTNQFCNTSRFLFIDNPATNCAVYGNTFQPTITARVGIPGFIYCTDTNIQNCMIGENTHINGDILIHVESPLLPTYRAFYVVGAQKMIGKNSAVNPYTMVFAVGSSGISTPVMPGVIIESTDGGNYPYWQSRSSDPLTTDAAVLFARWLNLTNQVQFVNYASNAALHSIATTTYWVADRFGNADPNTESLTYNIGSSYFNKTTGRRWQKGSASGTATGWSLLGTRRIMDTTSVTVTNASITVDLGDEVLMKLDPSADITLNGTDQLKAGVEGQIVTIYVGSGEANTVTFQDVSAVPTSRMNLGAASRTVGALDVLRLFYDGTTWNELSYADN